METFCTEWQKSDAGVAWKSHLEKLKYVPALVSLIRRRLKKSTSNGLALEHLGSFTFEGMEHKGVKLEGGRMWEFFSSILCIFDLEDFETDVLNLLLLLTLRHSSGQYLSQTKSVQAAPLYTSASEGRCLKRRLLF